MTAIDERALVDAELAIRSAIKADATGLAPAVIGHYLTGFEEAARAAITAYLQALRPGSTGEGWQPIETAPKDEWLLAWSGRHVEMATLRDGRWLVANSYGVTIDPTHWMPLPSPPSAMLAAAGGRDE